MLQSGVAHGSLLALAVTARAKPGNIGRKSRRLRVLFAKDGMRAMAFLADRGIRIVLGNLLSVDAGHVLLANFIVASGAVHGVGDGLASPHAGGIYFRVALAAGNLVVARMAYLAHADVHGLPVARAAQFLVGVAAQAVRVGHAQFIEDVPDLVRLVAVRAGGQDVGLFFPKLSTNNLAVDRFDLGWHLVQVAAMFRRLIEEAGSVCGKIECAVWQVAQVGATASPFFSNASPWMLSE